MDGSSSVRAGAGVADQAQVHPADPPNSVSECSVCLAPPTTPTQIPVLTACNHLFCWPCLDRWLGDGSTCPACRNPLHRDDINFSSIRVNQDEYWTRRIAAAATPSAPCQAASDNVRLPVPPVQPYLLDVSASSVTEGSSNREPRTPRVMVWDVRIRLELEAQPRRRGRGRRLLQRLLSKLCA